MANRRILLAVLGCIAIGVTTAIACGPDFPWELLNDRAATLKTAPDNSFAFEASHLVPSPAGLKLSGWQEAHLEPGYDYGQSNNKQIDEREALEKERLTPEQVDAVQAMRNLINAPDDQILKAGESLASDVRLYTAGAIAYNSKDYPKAQKYFQDAVATTPATIHSVMAGYMLGQTYDQQDNDDRAVEAYDTLQKTVSAGAPDPLNLAIDSYGDKARMLLDKAGGLIGEKDYKSDAADRASLLEQATQLYALQAATGSMTGVSSLHDMARDLTISGSPDLDQTIGDPIIQRLVVAHIFSGRNTSRPAKAPPENSVIAKLMRAMTANNVKTLEASDRLAALAYKTGQYDLARQFAGQSITPLGLWLQAKLAVQAGDLDEAAGLYSAAIRTVAANNNQISIAPGNQDLLRGEQSTLSLAKGEYTAALQQLYIQRPTYHDDAFYIAERILTPEELKTFVDANVPEPRTKQTTGDLAYSDSTWQMDNGDQEAFEIRKILANKLVRVGKYDEAIPYFDFNLHEIASNYAQAITLTQSHANRLTLAEAFYNAATIERRNGIDLMGYYGWPDERATGGAFAAGINSYKLTGDFITSNEKQRFAVTQARPDTRWHYREIAADHAEKAADLLPPRSQAFAASLCKAAQWTTDDGRKQRLYQRYVKNGAIVEFAEHFGNDCPDPDFGAAEHFATNHLLHQAHRAWHHFSVKVVIVLAAVIVTLSAVFAVLKHCRFCLLGRNRQS